MWPLLGLSIISLALAVERALFWLRTHGPGRRRWLRKARNALRSGDTERAGVLGDEDATVYGLGLRTLVRGGPSEAAAVELVEQARGPIERFGATHTLIITASPLLGILGTVLGIIDSFRVLGAAEGATDLSAAAGGIAEALITTAFGLIVALVTLVPHAVFRAQADRCISALELLAATRVGRKA